MLPIYLMDFAGPFVHYISITVPPGEARYWTQEINYDTISDISELFKCVCFLLPCILGGYELEKILFVF